MTRRSATYEQLATAFSHGQFAPLYLLYGEERYFVDRLQALLLEKAVAPHERDFNLDILYGRETDAASALAACASYPMMAERRAVVIRDFDALEDNERFKAYAEQPNPTAVVLLVAGEKVNMGHHPYRAIGEHGVVGQFKRLYEREIPRWLEQDVTARGLRIRPEAVRMLAEYVGTNLQQAATEIDKLAAFVGERTTIEADDVVYASGQTREYNVFELQNAVSERRYPDAMRIAERLLQQASNGRGEALMIVGVLTSFFTKLWLLTWCQAKGLSEKAMTSRIGVPPYYLKEYLNSLRRFDQSAIASAFSTLVAADYELKGGSSRDERLILGLLLRRLARSEPVPALAA
jgi:DNA polymerase-3 subunit delta